MGSQPGIKDLWALRRSIVMASWRAHYAAKPDEGLEMLFTAHLALLKKKMMTWRRKLKGGSHIPSKSLIEFERFDGMVYGCIQQIRARERVRRGLTGPLQDGIVAGGGGDSISQVPPTVAPPEGGLGWA